MVLFCQFLNTTSPPHPVLAIIKSIESNFHRDWFNASKTGNKKEAFSLYLKKYAECSLWEYMDSLKYERSRSSSIIFSFVSKRRILHQISDACPIKLSFDLQADIHENKLHKDFCKWKAQELCRYKQNNVSCCLPAPITSWVTYALRRPVMHFCYNFYRKLSRLGKSSFQVTVCSSRNRSTACHSTSSVCVVGSAALLPNNSKDQWRSLDVRVSTGRCHPLKTKDTKACSKELLEEQVSFLYLENLTKLFFTEAAHSSPSHRPLPPRWGNSVSTLNFADPLFSFISLLNTIDSLF